MGWNVCISLTKFHTKDLYWKILLEINYYKLSLIFMLINYVCMYVSWGGNVQSGIGLMEEYCAILAVSSLILHMTVRKIMTLFVT